MITTESVSQIIELLKKNDMIMIYFGNRSCGVCSVILPKLESMLKYFPRIEFVYVEIQSMSKLSANYGVYTSPTILLYIQGKETLREAGIISLTQLESKVARYYELFFENKKYPN